eukprot:TRINITY_DN837_c0_g1_i4.p1 TRINITY_DN837_c0_g1~~TRINITY_DN837_c0_g1_i4.p1  ORF type:complete len:223 (-),score=63.08 TRINITY_DN837_c0_g1_i4:34-702(-)
MKDPPRFILIENVKGFEESDSHEIMMEKLKGKGYKVREFLLNPNQFGIPNSRLRYYLIASLNPTSGSESDEGIQCSIPSCLPANNNNAVSLSQYLEEPENLNEYLIPEQTILKYGMLFDLVDESSNSSNCFTKNYASFMEGTGSILQTKNMGTKPKSEDEMTKLGLRFFTEKEIANLMGFPCSFSFPQTMKPRTCYKLLGNSLNVDVVSELVKLMINEDSHS